MEAKTARRPWWPSWYWAVALALTLFPLMLSPAHAAPGREIFKQADAEGRVTITDNPDPARRTLDRYPANSPAVIIVQKSPEAATAVNAPWPMQPPPSFNRPYDEVQFALDTNSRMSSPRTDAIDTREAARRARAAPASSPLHFNDVQFKPPSLRRYENQSEADRQPAETRKAALAALPALNWVAGSQVGVMLLVLWTMACVLLHPAWRRRLGLCVFAARTRFQGWMARHSGTA